MQFNLCSSCIIYKWCKTSKKNICIHVLINIIEFIRCGNLVFLAKELSAEEFYQRNSMERNSGINIARKTLYSCQQCVKNNDFCVTDGLPFNCVDKACIICGFRMINIVCLFL